MKIQVTFHRDTRPATARMIALAEHISETLDIPRPEDDGFDTIHEFIDKHIRKFQDVRRDLEADFTWMMNSRTHEPWIDDLPF